MDKRRSKCFHNTVISKVFYLDVVLYPKDTEKWKQFTTYNNLIIFFVRLFCIPKILKNESNSQRVFCCISVKFRCFVSQRYWKMKAIHNCGSLVPAMISVVLYPKDTEKWKQFTTWFLNVIFFWLLFCIPKILKNESNSQLCFVLPV